MKNVTQEVNNLHLTAWFKATPGSNIHHCFLTPLPYFFHRLGLNVDYMCIETNICRKEKAFLHAISTKYQII